jgi:hypothetical protein
MSQSSSVDSPDDLQRQRKKTDEAPDAAGIKKRMQLEKAGVAQHDAKSCTSRYSHQTGRLLYHMTKHSSAVSKFPMSKPRNINAAIAAKHMETTNAQHTAQPCISLR